MRSIDGSSDVSSSDLGRFVFDFGQNFAGWVRLKALAEASTEITLRFGELLNPDGTVDQSNLRLAECTDRFVLAGDSKAEVFEPHFTYHGLRYVEIEGYPGAPTADDIEGLRSEERRVGKECVSRCRSWGAA